MSMRLKNTFALIGFVLLAQCAGLIGSAFTIPAIDSWYAYILKPAISPPNWVFAPVWTTLFLLMGISVFLVWRQGLSKREVKLGLIVFFFQLALNTLWSIVFFGLESPLGALVVIAVLWVAIATNIWVFAKSSKVAAWLLVPYILWVSFASYLNFLIWSLNS